MIAKKLNHRQAQWLLYLKRLNFVLHQHPSKSIKKPDVKIVDGGLDFYFSLFILFYFILFYFSFSIFRISQVRGYQSRCHIKSQLDGIVTRLITGSRRRK